MLHIKYQYTQYVLHMKCAVYFVSINYNIMYYFTFTILINYIYFNNFLLFLCDYMYFMNFILRETNINLNLNYLNEFIK